MQRLSSGLRINSASDDAAGLGISERMRSQIRGLEQADRNIWDGISVLQTMDGALEQVHSILHRARDLAVQWNGGSLSDDDKSGILGEWAQLSNEIGRIEQSTAYGGTPLLQSFSALVTLQVGANDGETIGVGLVDLLGPNTELVRPNTFFAVPWIEADIDGFDRHIDQVSTARARIGATMNRLEHSLNSNAIHRESLMQAESRIRDVDMAAEMNNLIRHQITQATGSTVLLFADSSPKRVMDVLFAT
jgi:flagellin